jgi:hypothetical protein
MSTRVRDCLNSLTTDAMLRLCEMRDLRARSHDDRRSKLARSYRGNLAALFSDLRREDLVELLTDVWLDESGRAYRLRTGSGLSKAELEAIALDVCSEQRKMPSTFERVPAEDEDPDEEDRYAARMVLQLIFDVDGMRGLHEIADALGIDRGGPKQPLISRIARAVEHDVRQLVARTGTRDGWNDLLEHTLDLPRRKSREDIAMQLDVWAFEQADDDDSDDEPESANEPADSDDGEGESDDDDGLRIVVDDSHRPQVETIVGQLRVAAVRRSRSVVEWLAESFGWTTKQLTRALRGSGGRLVRNALEASWPPASFAAGGAAAIGGVTVGRARKSPWFVYWAAAHLERPPGKVLDEMWRSGLEGQTKLRTVFPDLVGGRNQGLVATAAQQATKPVQKSGPRAIEDSAGDVQVLPAAIESMLGVEGARSTSSDHGGGWSKLRPARALFAQVGLPVPSALTQEAFGALVEELELRGFDVASAEGVRLTPLHDAVSLDSELRLRHDAFAVPSASPRTGRMGDRGDTADRAVELGQYERASLRMELLTAGLGPEGASREQLATLVNVAADGLEIGAHHRALLEGVAATLAQTTRDPLGVITFLVRRLSQNEGEALLRAYSSLHGARHHEDAYVLLMDHWRALCQK